MTIPTTRSTATESPATESPATRSPATRSPATRPPAARLPASRLLIIAALAASATGPALAQGTDYPTRLVTVTTPFAPGSGPDAVLRVVAEQLGKTWKQRVIVENKPGGGGFIAIDTVRRAAPDGYALLQLDSEHLAALPHLYRQRKFETLKAFDPAASLFRTPFLIAVPTQSPWKSLKDLTAAARAEGGKLAYGSWGVGSPGHLGAKLLEEKTGVTMEHVPYREVSQLYMSVGNNEVGWSFASIPSSHSAFQSGKIRYLAVAAPKRIPQMPDVPTVAEAGGPADIDVNSFVVLVAPKGLPEAVRTRINDDVAKVVSSPDVKARLDSFAFEPISWSAQEIGDNAQAKSTIYKDLIERANISLD